MQKRHISNNIRLVDIGYSDFIAIDGFVLFLDHYKAFNTLENQLLLFFLLTFISKYWLWRLLCRVFKNCVHKQKKLNQTKWYTVKTKQKWDSIKSAGSLLPGHYAVILRTFPLTLKHSTTPRLSRS